MQLTVCGEMGGRPLEAMVLLGLGIDRLSITPAAVGPIKAMIRSLDLAELRRYIPSVLQAPPRNIREVLAAWGAAHSVVLS